MRLIFRRKGNSTDHLVSRPITNGYLLLSTDPPIVYLMDFMLRSWRVSFRWIQELLHFKRASFLIGITWSHESDYLLKVLSRRVRRKQRLYPLHRYIFLTNTPAEAEYFKRFGLEAVCCNHNAFVSEYLYYPVPEEKRYAAIYDAALAPFKRHELASMVDNLAMISYIKADSSGYNALQVARDLKNATWLNDPLQSPNYWLDSSQVNRYLSQAKVGLCLSAEEGAMYASAQYLLAGLPVVTTRNAGGRDLFFDSEYVRWVDDDPDAVASAVDELCSLNIDPQMIRQRTLKCFAEHRTVLLDLVNEIVASRRPGEKWAESWPVELPNKLYSGGELTLGANLRSLLIPGSQPPWRRLQKKV
jgi:glycosyltransferase involved in cell wall biosynthesis